MKKFIIVLLAVVVLFSSALPKQTARADGLTLAAVAGGAYAIASASGMDFSFTGYDGLGVSNWMQNKINSWLAGRTLAEAFGSDLIRLNVGKLLIPSAAVAGIVSFLNDFKTNNSLVENSQNSIQISSGLFGFPVYDGGAYTNANLITDEILSTFTITEETNPGISLNWDISSGTAVTTYNGNVITQGSVAFSGSEKPSVRGRFYKRFVDGAYVYGINYVWLWNNNESKAVNFSRLKTNINPDSTVNAIIPGLYSPPQGLNDLQAWEGTVADAPDTNIEDLLDDIFDQSAAGTLDVTGEVVDTPAEPQVSPVPTAAPGDVIGLDTISGQLESIDNTMTGVQEGVGEAVGQLEGINEGIGSISEALEVPTASEAPVFKFDLTTLFPFCIPFDIYRFVTMFSASPVAPHVQIPFNIPAVGLQYTFDLDFSSFDGVASVLRSVELIAFCVGLAILTSKVIRW